MSTQPPQLLETDIVVCGGGPAGINAALAAGRSGAPKQIINLLVAGRCISTSHEALATTRLTPSCMATGQAAGTAAGHAVKHQCQPGDIVIIELQNELRKGGALLSSEETVKQRQS
jgi:succinate dehydrogenase/fumarate reductase flavoprotein subunit